MISILREKNRDSHFSENRAALHALAQPLLWHLHKYPENRQICPLGVSRRDIIFIVCVGPCLESAGQIRLLQLNAITSSKVAAAVLCYLRLQKHIFICILFFVLHNHSPVGPDQGLVLYMTSHWPHISLFNHGGTISHFSLSKVAKLI